MANVIVRIGLITILSLSCLNTGAAADSALKRELDSLFVIASSAEIHYQDLREPAMDSIAAYGVEAVPYLIDRFSTKSAWERWTVIWIFQRIGAPAIPDLLRALKRTDELIVERVCWALGDVGDSTAVTGLSEVSSHPRWQVRDQSIEALGKIGDIRAADAVRRALSDSIGQVRKSAVVAGGILKLSETISDLVRLLGDDFYGARLTAVNSLLQMDTAAVLVAIGSAFDAPDPRAGNLACELLGRIGNDEAMRILLGQLESPDSSRRAHAALGLLAADPYDNCRFREKYYNDGTERLLRVKIETAIKAWQDETGPTQ
jgi:HEAT repeat protein